MIPYGDHECWVPAQGSIPAQRKHPEGHDWRLLSRNETYESRFVPVGTKGFERSYGSIRMIPKGHREVWYCTRCRLVEERET